MKIFIKRDDFEFDPIRENWSGRVVSVFLSRDNKKHNHRCGECGKIVFQYTGNTEFIFDGAVISEKKATVDVLCHGCRIIYRAM